MKLSLAARLARCFMYCCRLLPIKKNKIVFSSFFGTKYNDSPRVISEALEKQKNLDLVWILNDGVQYSDCIRTVKPKSLKSLYELGTAKIWVDNCRKMTYVCKRKRQYYIQTWHGGVCLKKVEGDSEERLPLLYIAAAKNDSRMADLFISACEWRTKQYRSAFWYDGEVLKCGLPRNSIYHQDKDIIKKKVWEFFSFDDEVNIILYAPTFRKGNRIDAYNLDAERVINAYKKRYSGHWVLIVKLHPNVSQLDSGIIFNENIVNGSSYSDINELIMCSKVMITDYSGCLFDAFHQRLETIIYAPDLTKYLEQERELYFDIRKLPAPVVENNDELIHTIATLDKNAYCAQIEKFESDMGYYPDEHATEEICSRIMSVIHDD